MKTSLNAFYRNIAIVMHCLLLLCVAENAVGQSIETAILQSFDAYRKNALQEKMFVHTDKDFYLAGEICWFKIYAVDAFFHKPLNISKVAYVELIDNSKRAIVQAKIELKDGSGIGSVYLPVMINSGNYQLRVYSNWMKNFDADYFFEKPLQIINTQKITDLPVNQPKAAYDIQFFPEGGSMVNGLQSKIAYKITDQHGKGMDCNAVVISNEKDTLLKFRPLKFGMGNFNLTSVEGKRYSAVITMPNGSKVSKDLPLAQNMGYTMSLAEEGPKQLKITVSSVTEKSLQSPMVYLFVHTRGSVKVAVSAVMQNGVATFLIDKDKTGDGISHYTVFNSDRKPVCERLYFKYPTENFTIKISADQAIYNLRQKINIGIASADVHGKPVEADMSLAVYRLDSLQAPLECGISEYLWLTSDLPGNVESPAYYFNTKDPSTAQAMENLMLVNGWRRFRWDDVLQNKKPFFQFAPEYNGHMISGKIMHPGNGSPAAGVNAFLSVAGTTSFRTSQSNKDGRIKFEMKHFYGSPGIIIQTSPEKDSAYRVEIDNPFSDKFSSKLLPAFLMPVNNPVTLLDQSINMQVVNIYNGDSLKKMNVGMIDTSTFYQHPNETYLLDNYTRFTTLEEVLREYVVSVSVRRRGAKFHLPVYNDADPFNSLFQGDPLILLDGVPVFDMDKIMKYDPAKIKRMDAVTRKYVYGPVRFEGIVNFVTYNGDLEGYELDPHAMVLDYEALQLQREFYSPVYETAGAASSHLPDFRNVLCWLPSIKTAKATGEYKNSFYSSDLPGKYVVEVQALSPEGNTGSNKIFFEVKKP